MEPIIAPSTFYWLEVVDNIKTCSIVCFGVSIAALALALLLCLSF